MWPFKRTLSERYNKLVKLIKSIDSHFQMTENKEDSLRLHLPNYKGNQPMDLHLYLMESYLFISFITEIEGEKVSVVNSYPKDMDQQDLFNAAMVSNLNKIHRVLEEKFKDDIEEKGSVEQHDEINATSSNDTKIKSSVENVDSYSNDEYSSETHTNIEQKSWPLLDFAKSHGKMKFTKPYTHVNPITGEEVEARRCVFIHPTNTDEEGRPFILFVEFSNELSELTAKEISEQKDDLVVVEYESGVYALDRRQNKKLIEDKKSIELADEELPNESMDDFLYDKIRECAKKLLLSLNNNYKKDLEKNLLLVELTILSAASVLDFKKYKNDNWPNFIEHRILNEYLSIKDVDDYDYWIESNTPGMYNNDLYTIDYGTSLEEFEKVNGQIKFFKGKINAYPYDDRLWGEFVDKNGNKQIIYVNQGFPSEYGLSELLNDKQGFGIVEEKDKYYHGDECIFCLKKIKKKHSMLQSYITKRLFFYQEAIVFAMSNRQNIDGIFQLYNAVKNSKLNYNNPYLPIGDLEIANETIINGITGEQYEYNATSLKNFFICIWESISKLYQEFNNI